MTGPLRFRELRVRRMPGFEDRGFRLEELADGINLVHGPNASGKTTAARAIRRLLWPGGGADRVWVSGRFELDGEEWRVEVDGGRVVWERDGAPSGPPALPAPGSADRYVLSLTELLESDDRDLAELIRVESAGGYDVPRAAGSLGFGAGGRPTTRVRALDDARARLDQARAEAESLRDDRRRLDDLRARLEELREKSALADALERALELAGARERADAAVRALEPFPDAIARLRGDEAERLDEWADRERELREAAATANDRVARAERSRDDADLGEHGLALSTLAELEHELDSLRRLDADVQTAQRDMAEARARREEAGEQLGVDPAEAPPRLSAAGSARLDAFLLRAGRLRERRAALEAWLELLDGAGERDADADDTLEDGIRVLRGWLRAAPAGAAADGAGRWRGLVTGSMVGFALLALGLGVGALAWLPAAGFGAAAALAAVVVLLLRPSAAADPRAGLEAEARRLGHAPAEWTVDAVRDHLDALERRAAGLAVDAERRAERDRRLKEREAVERAEALLEVDRSELAAALGLDPTPDDLSLELTARRLRRWDEARADEEAADARLHTATGDRDAALASVRRLTSPHGFLPAHTDAVAGALAELRDRRDRHERATADLAAARDERDRAASELEELAGKRAALLDRVGIDDEPTLRQLAARRDAWVDAEDARKLARRELDAAGAALRDVVDRTVSGTAGLEAAVAVGQPRVGDDGARAAAARIADGLLGWLTDAAPDALARRLDEARAAADQAVEVRERIAGIEARLNDARARHDVEEALAAVEGARADLAARRDRDVDDALGEALVGWLEASSSDTSRPAVFHRARRLLTTITRGQYRLEMARDGDAFRAFDTVAGRGRDLHELSAGTRIQLLLAVRIAFVETQEHGAAPPLLLDEVLANADDVRARAIIDAALALARDGRQVFYFTAQADELAKWRDALENAPDVSWARCGLADAPDAPAFEWTDGEGEPAGGPAGGDAGARAIAHPRVPAPEGRSHAEYRHLLDVPAWDPWAEDTGALHLWYLVDDPDALHTLLDLGIDRWGRLRGFARDGGDDLPAVRAVLDDARCAAEIVRRFGELWRQGRGRPLDRAALEDSGAITDTFIDRVADLCAELDGDADALLDALDRGDVPRFRASSVEELRAWCLEHGHLRPEQPLHPDEIRLRLVAGLAGEGGAQAADERVREVVGRLRAASGAEKGAAAEVGAEAGG